MVSLGPGDGESERAMDRALGSYTRPVAGCREEPARARILGRAQPGTQAYRLG